jgi:hypothetical protein
MAGTLLGLIKNFFQFDYSQNVPILALSYGFISSPLNINPAQLIEFLFSS